MQRKVLRFEMLGDVVFTKNPLSKSIRINVDSRGNVKVSLPTYTSFFEAEAFLHSMLRRVTALHEAALAKNRIALPEADGRTALVNASQRGLYLVYPNSIAALRIKKAVHASMYASSNPLSDSQKIPEVEQGRDVLSLRQINALAHEVLPKRLRSMYELMSKKVRIRDKSGNIVADPFRYNRLAIKNNSTNWGSCSTRRNINLNMHLVRIPVVLMDYVIAHELCHLVYRNHGKNFHALLNSITDGKERYLSKQINEYKL